MSSRSDTASPFGTTGPTGYTPAQVREAYGFDSIFFANGTIPGDGRGTTIAIVNAFDNPNIANDLHQFNLQFGLPDTGFTKVDQTGGTNYPRPDAGWIGEIALDVQWVHAIAPQANILLVEAIDNSYTNLLAAVDYARSVPGVVAVSMSWGGGEFQGENALDFHFTTPAGHNGVTFVVASGDTGAPASYPSASPNVISVGGTTLNLDSQGNIQSESAWGGSGGGISAFETKPVYQQSITMPQTTSRRATPDVAYDSNPNTGFPVYDSYNNGTIHPWYQVGGTSAAAPQWAALIAIAAQGRALNGLGSLDGPTQTLPQIYAMSASNFHDTTTGTSSGKPPYKALAGYDFSTGRGSPRADLIVHDFVGDTSNLGNPVVTSFAISAPASTTAGSTFSITVAALDAFGNVVPSYLGTIAFTSLDTIAGLPPNYAFTVSDNGVHTFNGVILKTAGSQRVTATDTQVNSVLGNATIIVNPAAAHHLVFGQQPVDVSMSAVIAPAVTVRVLDAFGNLVTTDNGRQITIQIGTNPGGGQLSGTSSVLVVNGVATFDNLKINQPGTGYTLTAAATGLGSVTSATFKVIGSRIIEDFEAGNLSAYHPVNALVPTATLSAAAAHDGSQGLRDANGRDWIYRNDAAAQVKQGDTISVWLRFVGTTTGLENFGFGAGPNGTLSLAASGQTNQLLIQSNVRYSSVTIGAATMTWQPDHWYRLEVNWATTGAITGKVFDSNGTTLLKSVTGTSRSFTSGGIAFRGVNGQADWDSVQVIPGSGGGGVVIPPKGPGAIGRPIPAVFPGLAASTLLVDTSTISTSLNAKSTPPAAVTIAPLIKPLLTETPSGRSSVIQSDRPGSLQATAIDIIPSLDSAAALDLSDTLFRNVLSI